MKEWETYYRTEDLKPYIMSGISKVPVEGLVKPNEFYILTPLEDGEVIFVCTGTNINTTIYWASSYDMAIANKIKLLENEIVSLEVLRASRRKV